MIKEKGTVYNVKCDGFSCYHTIDVLIPPGTDDVGNKIKSKLESCGWYVYETPENKQLCPVCCERIREARSEHLFAYDYWAGVGLLRMFPRPSAYFIITDRVGEIITPAHMIHEPEAEQLNYLEMKLAIDKYDNIYLIDERLCKKVTSYYGKTLYVERNRKKLPPGEFSMENKYGVTSLWERDADILVDADGSIYTTDAAQHSIFRMYDFKIAGGGK